MIDNGTIKTMKLYYNQQEKILRRRLARETDMLEKVEIIRQLHEIRRNLTSLTRLVLEPPKKPGVRLPLEFLSQNDRIELKEHPFGRQYGDAADEDWITVGGTHVLLGEGGVAMSGGKLKGKTFSRAKSQKSSPKSVKKSDLQRARDAYASFSAEEKVAYACKLLDLKGGKFEDTLRKKPESADYFIEKHFQNVERGYKELIPPDKMLTSEDHPATPSQQAAKSAPIAPESQAAKPDTPKRAQAGHRENVEYLRSDYRRQEAIIAKECGVSAETASDMYDAIQGYAGQMSFMDIRLAAYSSSEEEYTAKAGPYALSYSDAKDCADTIESYIEKAPVWNGGTLYRSIKVSADEAESIAAAARSGETLDQRGVSSWTSYKITGSSPSSSGTEIVFVTPGTKQGTSINHLSPTDEGEVLISGKARWRASNVYEQNGAIFIECDEQ